MTPGNKHTYEMFIDIVIIYSEWGVQNIFSSHEGASQKIIEKHWNKTAKGRVNVACSSSVYELKSHSSFWIQRSMMIAPFLPCSKRAFPDVLEGMALKTFLGVTLQTHLSLSSLTHIVLFCVMQWCAYVSPFGEV